MMRILYLFWEFWNVRSRWCKSSLISHLPGFTHVTSLNFHLSSLDERCLSFPKHLVIVVDFTPGKVGGTMVVHFDKNVFQIRWIKPPTSGQLLIHQLAFQPTRASPVFTKLTCKNSLRFCRSKNTKPKTVETSGYLRNNWYFGRDFTARRFAVKKICVFLKSAPGAAWFGPSSGVNPKDGLQWKMLGILSLLWGGLVIV